MVIFELISTSIYYVIAVFLLINCLYLLFFSLAGLKKIKPISNQAGRYRKSCILIPVYREDVVILATCQHALEHTYPGDFDVVVIADGLKKSTIKALKSLGAIVIEVSFEHSTKGKALCKAMEVLPEFNYEIAIVLDVDNIMGVDFLKAVNQAFEAGYSIIQTHRIAKNMETTFAFLDACNEEINNHIFRKGHFALGMSPALIGSGMAFSYPYLKQLLSGIGDTTGEDKELEFKILKARHKIGYLENVYVYDEKTGNAKAFTQQRTRWLSTHLEYLKKYSVDGTIELFKYRNTEFFGKVVQCYILPRIILLGILVFNLLPGYLVTYGPGFLFSVSLLGLYGMAMFLALPNHLLMNKRIWHALFSIPTVFFCMCKALFNINKAKTAFLVTPHKAKVLSTPVE
jgi:cellulose synthase/poly-beta-1,6-N-acetylglucosamine synthase-like glycosyltransferase